MPKKLTDEQLDAVIKSADSSKIKTLEDFENVVDGKNSDFGRTEKNEFLEDLAGVLSRQAIINTINVNLGIANTWMNGTVAYGELEQLRQTLFAKRGIYSNQLDVNAHYKPRTIEEYVETTFRDRYDLSISSDIIKNAFLGKEQLGSFVSNYMNSLPRTYELTWSQRLVKMFRNLPLVYKLDTSKETKEIGKELGLLLKKMTLISPYFNVEGLPTKLEESNRVVVLSTTLKNKLDWDTLSNVFNLNVTDGELRNDVKFIDFGDDGLTLGVILDKRYSFWIDDRFMENTNQGWAKTLITDFYLHDWKRAKRIDMAVSVRIVDKAIFEKNQQTKINWKDSPFTHYKSDGKTIAKDEQDLIVLDSTSLEKDFAIPQGYEIDLSSMLVNLPNDSNYTGAKTAPAITAWIADNNIDITDENILVVTGTDAGIGFYYQVKSVAGLSNFGNNSQTSEKKYLK